ncbi:MAG: archease [Armatimonadia bacterium]
MPKFDLVEHTADQAIRAYGRDMRELVENAAAGMLALLYIEPLTQADETLERQIEAESPELLVHHALRELLYLLEDEALAPVTVEVTEATEQTATLRVSVIPREAAETLFGAPIKAVTRHGLQITPQGDLLTVTVVFDV